MPTKNKSNTKLPVDSSYTLSVKVAQRQMMTNIKNLPHDLGSGHTAYRHVSLIDLYLQSKCRSNWKNFLWMDVRTDEWPDIEV